MEVHHKSHVPKKIAEYITEFIMLFTAVTLGFFAENYREHTLVERRMYENYQALVEDLKADSANMSKIIVKYEDGKKAMMALNYLLYQFHTKSISKGELNSGFKKLNALPTYATVFINNTTFKNIQSSGMLTYVTPKDLRFDVSYYYEVLFKQLQDNNALFDHDGMDFFDKALPFSNVMGKTNIEREEAINVSKNQSFSNPSAYYEFMLNLPESQKILQSEKLVYQCKVYYQRYANYIGLVKGMMDKNNKLLAKLKHI